MRVRQSILIHAIFVLAIIFIFSTVGQGVQNALKRLKEIPPPKRNPKIEEIIKLLESGGVQ